MTSILAWATQVQPGTPAPPTPHFDLTSLGYTSLFLHLPKQMAHINPDSFPIPPSPTKPRSKSRFRSLSLLRPRSLSSPKPPPTPKQKKSTYPKIPSSSAAAVPVPLANELALMQLMDGGSTDTNLKRLMHAQARAGVVDDVYRDGDGGIWRDRDEQLEYAHLLAKDASDETMQWVTFAGHESERGLADDPSLALASLARRGSSSSAGTLDSDLDPTNLVRPADDDAHLSVPTLHLPLTRPLPPAVLSIPTRPARAHLRKNPGFILDLAAFPSPCPSSPSPYPRTPLSPTSPNHTTTTRTSPPRPAFPVPGTRPRRRRPAPLKLVGVPRAPPHLDITLSPSPAPPRAGDTDPRQAFIDASFAPAPLPVGLAPLPACNAGLKPLLKKKASRMALAFFARRD